MEDSNESEAANLASVVEQNKNALEQLKNLPLLVHELSSKLSRVKESSLMEPPPSLFSPLHNEQNAPPEGQTDGFNQFMAGINRQSTSKPVILKILNNINVDHVKN